VEDDIFFPIWKDKATNGYPYTDRVELYFDVNGIKPDGEGPSLGNGVFKGHYQITDDYDYPPEDGKIHPGKVDSTWQANTWEFADPANLTTEWCVSFKALKDSNNVQFDPMTNSKIAFDVYILDWDGRSGYIADEQVWSNVGHVDENWNNMDSAGILSFDMTCCKSANPCNPVSEISTRQPAITPTLASDYINVISTITRIEIVDIMGRTVMQVANINGIVDISALNRGIFYVRLFKNKDFAGIERIIKY
jgi:hypothetical protein